MILFPSFPARPFYCLGKNKYFLAFPVGIDSNQAGIFFLSCLKKEFLFLLQRFKEKYVKIGSS